MHNATMIFIFLDELYVKIFARKMNNKISDLRHTTRNPNVVLNASSVCNVGRNASGATCTSTKIRLKKRK